MKIVMNNNNQQIIIIRDSNHLQVKINVGTAGTDAAGNIFRPINDINMKKKI